ncbi:PadR family transcriptional regulator [Cytobacillus sp. FSL R5-0569]|uniref:PadR family transcriptional regulator n=1 Tax=Cytobacillus sp. FSL R5-0569 TaxID=2921649 RepID=UPI0030F70377
MSVKHAILTLLSQSPRHRYDLKVSFESMVYKQWDLNAGQIYTTIDRLIRDEFVQEAQEKESELKIYRITPKGKAELQKWLLLPVESSLLQDEFYFKLLCAKQLSFKNLGEMIKQHKELIIKNIFQLQQLRNSHVFSEENEAIHYLIDGKILHLEAEMKWIEMLTEN